MSDTISSTKTPSTNKDFVPRGNKSSSPIYTTLFLGIRIADCFFQYAILAHGLADPLITALGGHVLPKQNRADTFASSFLMDTLSLTPYRALILLMIIAAAVKHIWFVMCVAQEAWTLSGAVIVGLFNTFWFSTNTILSLWVPFSAAAGRSGIEEPSLTFYIGALLFWLGISVETIAEVQRKSFKDDRLNKGKCFSGGLFGICRHINYAGYSLWRAGLACATGGWLVAVLTFAFFVWDFTTRAIPALDSYCLGRYGTQWVEYKRRVPHMIIPLVY